MPQRVLDSPNRGASWYARHPVPRRISEDDWLAYDKGINRKPMLRKVFWERAMGIITRDPVISNLRSAERVSRRIQKKIRKVSKDYHKDQLIPDELFEKELVTLSEHFNNLSVPALYRDWQADRREAFITTCLSSKQFKEAASSWPLLREEARRRFINNFINTHRSIYAADFYDSNDYLVSLYKKPRPKIKNPSYVKASFFPRSIGDRYIFKFNTHEDAKFDNFYTAINVVQHECTHMDQQEFSDLYCSYNIDQEHALYDSARFWYLIMESEASYIKRVRGAYLANPMEVDAFKQGDLFSNKIELDLNLNRFP